MTSVSNRVGILHLIDLLVQPMPAMTRSIKNHLGAAIKWQLVIALLVNILSLALPIMMLQVYDRIIPHQSYGTLVMLVMGVLSALICEIVLRFARSYLTSHTAAMQEHEVGRAAVHHILQTDLTAFERIGSATHLQNMMALSRLREFYSGQSLTALIDMPFVVLFLALIAYLGHVLVLVPIALLAVFIVTATYVGNNLKRALSHRAQQDDHKIGFIVSLLTGIHTAKSFGMEDSLLKKFIPYQNRATEASYDVATESGMAGVISAVFGQLSLILTATAGCFLVLNNELSIGGLTACTLLAGRAIQPVQRILGTWLRTQDLMVSRAQAEELFAMPARDDMMTSVALPLGKITVEKAVVEIDSKTLLKQINLEAQPGDMIAISGSKGSGKSTLLQLIAGILTPNDGHVRLDDKIDPAAHAMSDLKQHIGYLPQIGTIYKGTILENLTGFDTNEAVIARAKTACSLLNLDITINQLPHGFDTVLNDNNADPVPPGVKQRIALTRVLANDPAIILFDDADRTLDKSGYNALFRLLGEYRGKKTIILVSHDQNFLAMANRYYFLDQGVLKQSSGNMVFFNQPSAQQQG